MRKANGAIIQVCSVSFWYGTDKTPVLEQVSLEIERGEFVAFIGQNGAGKTTLAKLFNGILLPSDGSVLVEGRNTREAGLEALARIVGYCYQNPDHQIFSRTVKDEIAFGPRNLGMTSEQVEQAVAQALRLVEMEQLASSPPFLLGRGQRQKLAVASILAMGSPVLVVDEPTTGLDLRGTRSIMNLLNQWNQDGRTIVIITHDMNIVAEYAQRVVVMASGKILADGPTREVLSDEATLAQAFLKAPQITRVAQQLDPRFGLRRDILTVEEMLREITQRVKVSP
ncbi:MAG: ATP-binding cassette domain-containing protein [Ardenticatenaceae bacterium]|nr:ATP-binding cassette domain-containing protein [Ardenticatenaceae bacterium]HBY93521.1 energy-coupling factor ABC transporter ATP-binding protein [Chloroflexota bacterium]